MQEVAVAQFKELSRYSFKNTELQTSESEKSIVVVIRTEDNELR